MKKTAILLLCCGMFMSVVGCGGNTSPLPTERPPTTAQPKEESKPTVTENPTELSTAEISEPTEETPSNSEESQEEIYVGIEWPEVDTTEIKKLVIEKINAYRIEQGDTAATMLPGLTKVARFRADELITNFSHTDIRNVCKELKYGEFIDMTLYGMTAEDSYYQGYNREAIGMGDLVWHGRKYVRPHSRRLSLQQRTLGIRWQFRISVHSRRRNQGKRQMARLYMYE